MALSLGEHRRLLTTYLRPQRGRVALLAVLLLAGIGLQLVNPQVMRFFIDTAQAGGPLRALLLAALVYLAAGLVWDAAWRLRPRTSAWTWRGGQPTLCAPT